MSGSAAPSTFIRLDETATASGTSITPVREALRTLLGERAETIEHHPMLIDALRRRDAKTAAALPRSQYRNGSSRLATALEGAQGRGT
jgi:DNA-binding GntR family transcriptional regulator